MVVQLTQLATFAAFLLHIVLGCCLHHGHEDRLARFAQQAVPSAPSERSTVTPKDREVRVSAAGGPCCGASPPDSPQPCRRGSCTFLGLTGTKLPDLDQQIRLTAVAHTSPSGREVCHHRIEVPIIAEIGCPLFLSTEAWLQSWRL